MKRRYRPVMAGILVVLAFIVFLVTSAPARLAGHLMERLPFEIRLVAPSGTLWNGRAAGLVLAGVPLGSVHWRLRPSALLRGALRVEAELDGEHASLRGTIVATPGRVTASGLDAAMPAWLLAEITGVTGPVDASLHAAGLELVYMDGRPVAVSGDLHLRDVRVTGASRTHLGDYRLTLGMEGNRMVASVVDDAGDLAVIGDIRYATDGAWEIDLRVAARTDDEVLRSIVAMLGEPDSQGFRRLNLKGSLLR